MTRTITNPATSSSISSSVIRNELQLLENEIASGADPGHTHSIYAPIASPTFTGTFTAPVGLTGIAKLASGVLSAVTAPSGAIVGTSDSQALTNKDLTSGTNTFPTFNQNTTGSAAKLTTARTIAGVSFDGSANIAIASTNLSDTASIVLLTSTQVLTNKQISPRLQSVADAGGTLTPSADANDIVVATALSQATTIAAPTPTVNIVQGQKLIIRLKDNGTARALTWNSIYRAGTSVSLPTTTTLSKTLYCGFIYNSTDTKWDLVAYTDGY